MKSNKIQRSKIIYAVLLVISLCCIGVCIYMNVQYKQSVRQNTEDFLEKKDEIKQFDTAEKDIADTGEQSSEAAGNQESTEQEVKVETLDFEKLWEINPDICAWIEIKGAGVDYPVLQSKENDKKYLNTAYDGTPFIGGSIFTESKYNSDDFTDPVTVLYGHTMSSGAMFGSIRKTYSSAESFKENSNIRIYLPDRVNDYTVFAAVPYKKTHLLHNYDFSNDYWYNNFFKEIGRIRAIGANLNPDIFPKPGDRVIILSTCLDEDRSRRFLVMAIHQEDIY